MTTNRVPRQAYTRTELETEHERQAAALRQHAQTVRHTLQQWASRVAKQDSS